MTRYYCQDHPLDMQLEARVIAIESNRILLDRSPFFPGGGGQLADRGVIQVNDVSATVTGIELTDKGVWHSVDQEVGEPAVVWVRINEAHRNLQCELHTLAHIVNAIVFQEFDGALLTGAQLNENGTLRVDFDLPGVDNNRLRSLESVINETARADHPVSAHWMPWEQAEAEAGLFRAKSATPPRSADGLVRVVQIGDVDRQACGGTHVRSSGDCRPIRIMKIENKGRQNRRVRLGIVGLGC